MEKNYRTKEAAGIIGVDPRTLRRWIKAGTGPAHSKLNGLLYFTATDLAKFKEASRTEIGQSK
jgi:predicted site-specific integrase-resolvase